MLVQLRRQANGFARRIPDHAILAGAEALMLVALSLVGAQLMWTIVTPVDPFGDWQPRRADAAQAVDPAMLAGFDPFFRTADASAPTAVSTLALSLLGTRVDTVSGRGSAIIATEDGKQSSFMVGEEVVPGVRLKSVGFDEVVLDRGGSAESLFLDQSGSAAPVTPAGAGDPPVAATAPGGSRARLAADIMVTPRLNGSTISGYVLAPKGSGAAFAAAGLRAGDVLVSVDGAAVSTIADPASLARRLDAGDVAIGIERGGQTIAMRIGSNQ